MQTESMTDKLIVLETKSKGLKKEIDRTPAMPVRIHPNLGELYRQKVPTCEKRCTMKAPEQKPLPYFKVLSRKYASFQSTANCVSI